MTFDEFYDILHDFLNEQPHKVYKSLYNNLLETYEPSDNHDITIQVFKDIRTRNFTIYEIKDIANYLNRVYTGVNKRPLTANFHEVTKADGTKLGKHFHIEFQE